METQQALISINELNISQSLLRVQEKIASLLESNINTISELNRVSYILPLETQSVILLYLIYKYNIPVATAIALYQLYANDLIVIALTLIDVKGNAEQISEGCRQIVARLNGESVRLAGEFLIVYSNMVHCTYEGKIFVPADFNELR